MYLVSLNGVELNPNLSWAEEFSSWGVVQDIRHTLAGVPVISRGEQRSQEITLTATEDSGWLTTAMVEHLMGIPKTEIMALTIDDRLVSVPVVFRHNEPPALIFRPLTPRSSPLPTDYWVGTIKLLKIT